MEYVDLSDFPVCETCGGSGWIRQHDDNELPCETCEAEDAVMRAEHFAEIDALRAFTAALQSDDRAAFERALDRIDGDFLPF